MRSRFLRLLSGFGFLLILGSCYPAIPTSEFSPVPITNTAQPASTTTEMIIAQPATATIYLTPTNPFEPAPTTLERPFYQIHASMDTRVSSDEYGEMMLLQVQEQVTYPNRSAEPITDLVLQFEPARRPELFELQYLSQDRAAQASSLADGQLHIPLEVPLAPGETVSIRLDYQRKVARGNELIGRNDFQIILGNWYAFFPPYREGKGWLAHLPGKVGEYLNFPYADFDVELEVIGDNSYQVAASGIPEEGMLPLRYRFTGRSFAIALTKQSLFLRTAGSVEVLGFARPEYSAQGDAMATTAAQALGFYSEQFGEYPHRRFTVLESELLDGMEFDGLVFLNPELFEYYTGDGRDYLTAISAHETAHQWWYGRVGNDQALEPWLDEAFAAYSELLFYEHFYPGNLEWWWWTRVNRYPSSQCVDLPVYSFTTFRSYVDAVYLRGAAMLDAVRYRMGRQAFSDSVRELQSTGMGSMITSADVFRIFQSHSLVPLWGIWSEFVCQAVPAEP